MVSASAVSFLELQEESLLSRCARSFYSIFSSSLMVDSLADFNFYFYCLRVCRF